MEVLIKKYNNYIIQLESMIDNHYDRAIILDDDTLNRIEIKINCFKKIINDLKQIAK